MNKITLVGTVCVALGVSLSALANHHEQGHADAGDKCEGMAKADFSISGFDANKDGVITKDEYLGASKRNTEKLFAHLDANSDGKLDQAEQADIEAVYTIIHQDMQAKHLKI